MYIRNILTIIALLLFLPALSSGTALAAEDKVTLGVDVGLLFDSNVYLENEDEDSDTIVEIRPWIQVRLPFTDDGTLTADYILTGKSYLQEDDNNSVEHDLMVELDLRGATYYLVANEEFGYSAYPIASDLVQKGDNWRNTISAGVGAKYHKLGWEAGFRFIMQSYNDIPEYDYDDLAVYAEGNYLVGSKTDVFIRGHFGWITYDKDYHPDADYYDIKVGLRGKPTERLSYEIGVGYHDKNYEDDGTLADIEDYSGLSAKGEVVYKATERSNIGAVLSYYPQEGTLSNYVERLYMGVKADTDLTQKISASAELGLENGQNSLDSDLDYTKYSLEIKAKYAIRRNVLLSLETDYVSRSSDTPTREYDRITAGMYLTLRY
ncbi:MAG: outer membrane beta-barrel protein [Planctomycetota bacterium]|nr:outer membrane beta-barrel protein [Planctomycetota bacterium]